MADTACSADEADNDIAINELILAYWRHAQEFYRTREGNPSREPGEIRIALNDVQRLCGPTPAKKFAPRALKAVSESLVKTGIGRRYCNHQLRRIKAAFAWASSVISPTAGCTRTWLR